MKLADCRVTGRKSAGFNEAYDREITFEPKAILEIGVQTGDSLRMWMERFPNAKVVGIDIEETCGKPEGATVVIGDGHDPDLLAKVWGQYGPFDLVIDDGSHQVAHQIRTFEALLPRIGRGGMYVCEDLHTSYWPQFVHNGEPTFIDRAKASLDELHAYARNSDRHHQKPYFPLEDAPKFSSLAVYPGIAFFRV